MKLKVPVLALLLTSACSVHGDVLYWQVASSTISGLDQVDIWARLVTDSSGRTDNLAQPSSSYKTQVKGSTLSASDVIYLDGANGATLSSDITGYKSSASFWVELYSDEGEWIGRTTGVSGSSLVNYVHTDTTFTPTGMSQAAYNFGGFTTVPEPTSGLLMLIGAGLLGLRRRKIA